MSELTDITRKSRLQNELAKLNENIKMYGKRYIGKQSEETLLEYTKRVFFVALNEKTNNRLLWMDYNTLLFIPIDGMRVLVIDENKQAEQLYMVTEYLPGCIEIAEFLENASAPMNNANYQIESLQEMLH